MANARTLQVLLLGLVSSAVIFNSVNVQATSLLFAFGDSYADVGNTLKGISPAWRYPYGITWPLHDPAGRFSDGKISTDWIGKSLKTILSASPLAFVSN